MTLEIHDTEDMPQRSEAWFAARRGLVTASSVGKLISVGSPGATEYECPKCGSAPTHPCLSLVKKTPTPIQKPHDERTAVAAKEAATAPPVLSVADNETSRALTATLAAERVAGFTEETPMSSDMSRGVWSEPFARDLYSTHYAQAVECGLMVRTEDGWSLGWSPDGLVEPDGAIEIKAPRSKGHLLTVVAGEVPQHYMAQCQAALLVSGRAWIDFVSYVGGLHIYVKRVLPDPAWFAVIEAACRKFESDAAALVADYSQRVEGRPVAERIPTYFDLEVV